MNYILYKLNFSSGKSYIGQTVRSIHRRMQQHRQSARKGSPLKVHIAWRDFGEPEINILGKFKSQKELNDAEIKAIFEHKTLTPNGYNISEGGDNAPSKNQIVAKKISKLAKGRKHSKETLEGMRKTTLALWQDPEYREKVSAGLKKAWTPKMRKERSKWAKKMNAERIASGWKMPEEALKKMKGRICSEETRAKMSESAKKRIRKPPSVETRKKLSEAAKEKWKDKEHSKKRIEAILKAKGLI